MGTPTGSGEVQDRFGRCVEAWGDGEGSCAGGEIYKEGCFLGKAGELV